MPPKKGRLSSRKNEQTAFNNARAAERKKSREASAVHKEPCDDPAASEVDVEGDAKHGKVNPVPPAFEMTSCSASGSSASHITHIGSVQLSDQEVSFMETTDTPASGEGCAVVQDFSSIKFQGGRGEGEEGGRESPTQTSTFMETSHTLTSREGSAGFQGGGGGGGSVTQISTKDVEVYHWDESTTKLQKAFDILHFQLSDTWTVLLDSHTEAQSLRLVRTTLSSNPRIKMSISYSDDCGIEVYAHNRLLLFNHYLWNLTKIPDKSDAFSVSQTLCNLALKCQEYNVCQGSVDKRCEDVCNLDNFAKTVIVEEGFSSEKTYRSIHCSLFTYKTLCESCCQAQNTMVRKSKKLTKSKEEGRDLFGVNLKYYHRQELVTALQNSRSDNKKYQRQIKDLKARVNKLIQEEGHQVSKSWSNEFKNINQENFEKMSPIQKLFWDQQLKAASLKNKCSMRWHPMMIRLALYFQSLSSSAMENVKNTGFVTLPSKRTLYDFSHAFKAEEGCQAEVLKDLKQQFDQKCTKEHEKYVDLMFDEMTIRADLVYQKSTGEFVGYTRLSAIEQEFENLQGEWTGCTPQRQLAKKILVFMVKNIAAYTPQSTVKGVVAIYSVSNLKAADLYSKVWDVIFQLEAFHIPVLAVTCDGASTNRRFIAMHPGIESTPEKKILYSTLNIASTDFRTLFFIIDPPHLLKTIRNCFANSGAHKRTRRLWKNGEEITWKLIEFYFNAHKSEKFRKAHRISSAHVYLTSFSLMKVLFAAQVMSKTLAEAIKQEGEKAAAAGKAYPQFKETVKFMLQVNDFFDCLNGHHPKSHIRFKNDNLRPYLSLDDCRFNQLLDFVKYFDDWEKEVKCRPGRFTKKQRKQMVISDQTVQALNITVHSFIGATKFLIQKGADAVCARRYCQDPLEQYFSIIRQRGGGSNNPNLLQALHSRVSLHAQRQIALPSSKGNTMCEKEEIEVDSTPVAKRTKYS